MAHRKKKPQFKNPYDFNDEGDEDEAIPIQPSYRQYQQPTVHNPLPFNPYVISKEESKKNSGPVTKTIKPIAQPVQPYQNPNYVPPQREERPQKVYQLNEDGDPPLLEDIGIDLELIKRRMMLILKLEKPDEQMIEDPDLSGPILIALCMGCLLLLSGKVQFGDIYAVFVLGNILLYFLFNLMSQVEIIPLYSIMSTVGYALLPMLILCLVGIFASLKGTAGILLSLAISGWSSLAASNFIETMMIHTEPNRKALLMYPLFLFYVSFAMIVIF